MDFDDAEPEGNRSYRKQASKTKKQLKEKRRRGRIGEALDDLKALVYQNKDKKVDKVEVLEYAVNFIKDKKKRDDQAAYLMGYNACLIEMTDFLMQASFIDYSAKTGFLSQIANLSTRVEQQKMCLEQTGMVPSLPVVLVSDNISQQTTGRPLHETISEQLIKEELEEPSSTMICDNEAQLTNQNNASYHVASNTLKSCTSIEGIVQFPPSAERPTPFNSSASFPDPIAQATCQEYNNGSESYASKRLHDCVQSPMSIRHPASAMLSPIEHEQYSANTGMRTPIRYASPQQRTTHYAQSPQKLAQFTDSASICSSPNPSTASSVFSPVAPATQTMYAPGNAANTPQVLDISSTTNSDVDCDLTIERKSCAYVQSPDMSLNDLVTNEQRQRPPLIDIENQSVNKPDSFFFFPAVSSTAAANSPEIAAVQANGQQTKYPANYYPGNGFANASTQNYTQGMMQEAGHSGSNVAPSEAIARQLSALEAAQLRMQSSYTLDDSGLSNLSTFMQRMYGIRE